MVAAGGALGASARWFAGTVARVDPGSFPWATLAVNLLGAAGIGLAAARLRPGGLTWLFVVTGLLGGFTTFSAFAVETVWLLDAGRGVAALADVVASFVGGVTAFRLAARRSVVPT